MQGSAPSPRGEDRAAHESRRRAYIIMLVTGLASIALTWVLRAPIDRFVRLIYPFYVLVNAAVLTLALDRRRPVATIERFGFAYSVFVLLMQTLSMYFDRITEVAVLSAFSGVQQATIVIMLISHVLFTPRQANWINALVVAGVAAVSAPALWQSPGEMLSVWSRYVLFSIVIGAVFNILTVMKGQLARERLLSATDALTGTANRRKVAQELDLALEGGVSVILYDLDYFKVINDDYGHGAGDTVLRDSAALARTVIQESGLPHATLGRWGGEEFLVVLPDTALETADRLAEKMRLRFEIHRFTVPVRVTASFGVARRLEGESAGQLVRRADQALYQAKFSGRNIVWTSLRHHTTGFLGVN